MNAMRWLVAGIVDGFFTSGVVCFSALAMKQTTSLKSLSNELLALTHQSSLSSVSYTIALNQSPKYEDRHVDGANLG
jgi:hypothetical protein